MDSDLVGSVSLGLGGGADVLLERTFNVTMFHIWKTSPSEYKQQEVFGLVECARNQWFATRHLDE